MDNYAEVVHQMEAFGVEFLPKDLPLQIDAPKRRGCGRKGKWWYWLRTFRPDAGAEMAVFVQRDEILQLFERGVIGSHAAALSHVAEVRPSMRLAARQARLPVTA